MIPDQLKLYRSREINAEMVISQSLTSAWEQVDIVPSTSVTLAHIDIFDLVAPHVDEIFSKDRWLNNLGSILAKSLGKLLLPRLLLMKLLLVLLLLLLL